MAEFRKDILTGEWTIIAEERSKRSGSFITSNDDHYEEDCPFCKGKEEQTPKELLRFDRDGKIISDHDKDWTVRVVPNKFPALNVSENIRIYGDGFFESMGGYGLHEIVVHHPHHVSHLHRLSKSNIAIMLKATIARILEMKKNEKIQSIIIVCNQGKTAGASIEHTHSQILAMPLIPSFLKKELMGMINFFNNHQHCAICKMIEQEKRVDKRIIHEDDFFILFAPFASKSPYEVWIAPKRHMSDFEMMTQEERDSFSRHVKLLTSHFYDFLKNPPFNYYIHTAPSMINTGHYYHWHYEFLPRLTVSAGFEMATGQNICIISPERAAREVAEGF